MHNIPMPRDLLSLQGFGDFGMTTLSYHRGEWGKHVTALCPKISVVFNHAKDPTEVFDSSWQCKCKDCLYLFCCGLIPSVVSTYSRYSVSLAQNLDFWAFTFRPTSRSLVSPSLSFSRWSSRLAHVIHNKSCNYVFTNSRATISSDILPERCLVNLQYPSVT